MNTTILDTNCLISFVSDRNPGQQEKIADLLDKAGRLQSVLIIHHHVISEFVYVLTGVYGLDAEETRQMIVDLIAMPGVLTPSEIDVQRLLALWPAHIPDYGDAVLAAFCQQTRGASIVTFDRKFNRVLRKAGIPVQDV